LAAATQRHSKHPVAQAILEFADTPSNVHFTEVEEMAGLGLKGLSQGIEILVGNLRLLEKHGIDFPSALRKVVDTLVVIAINGSYAGHLTIADRIKEGTAQTLHRLRSSHIQKTVMLSGDRQPVVDAVAKELGIDEAHGELLPQDKVRIVEDLKKKGHTIAFVGDGINDAPVITLADVGMAMGGLGSDAAIETADVVIQNDQRSEERRVGKGRA